MAPADTPGMPACACTRVAEDIAARITAGQLAGRLPAEREIARDYGVSCGTARHALAALRRRGLVTTLHGIGSFTIPAAPGTPPSAAEMIAFLASWLG